MPDANEDTYSHSHKTGDFSRIVAEPGGGYCRTWAEARPKGGSHRNEASVELSANEN